MHRMYEERFVIVIFEAFIQSINQQSIPYQSIVYSMHKEMTSNNSKGYPPVYHAIVNNWQPLFGLLKTAPFFDVNVGGGHPSDQGWGKI